MKINKFITCENNKLSGSLNQILSDHLKLSKKNKCYTTEVRESNNEESALFAVIIYYTGKFSQKVVDQKLESQGYEPETDYNEPCDYPRPLIGFVNR